MREEAMMMLEFIEWQEAADAIKKGIARAIADRVVTYDLARLIIGILPSELGHRHTMFQSLKDIPTLFFGGGKSLRSKNSV
ncbi:hypothetical protein [Lusitaniella coriacea]|uniref:hypothetical protein n=1 Tax=Lusitaniella coriacea TaxID=1983105 RepID=UPI003CE99E84